LDIEYCIDKIASHQLYEAAFCYSENDEAAGWMQYGANK
jgi:hypothetical protein